MITTWNLQRGGLVVCVLLLAASRPSSQTTLASKIDAIVTSPVSAGRLAGISIAVVKGIETLVEKAYGFADLLLDIPTSDRAVYEIGSVTKQFTAAAILLLAEERKLSLDDELTKHLPDYPTQGHRVTIRHRLNHTSGIKSYSGLPDFRALFARQTNPRQTGRVAGRPDEIRFEARGADLYYGRQRLQYLGSDTFELDDVLFVFQRENGHVSRVRRDTVDTNLVLSRTPALTQRAENETADKR